MFERVVDTISRHTMLPPGARVVPAVSGGPDSVCLLHVLIELAPRLDIHVAGIAHVNHKLRGAESEADERFVAELAGSFRLPLHRTEAEVSAEAGNLEQALRRARREFFSGLIQGGAATQVALGHTRDDQAETVLFRLLRGCGISGLAGILPKTRDGVVRPLLDVPRAEVAEFLRSRGIAYREDSSNRDFRFARNRIRHQLLPQLQRDWNLKLADSLAQLADLAYQEEVWWGREVARLAPAVMSGGADGVELNAGKFTELQPAAARRVLRYAIQQAKGDLREIGFVHIDAIMELLSARRGGGRLAIPGLLVTRSFGEVRLTRGIAAAPVSPQPVRAPGVYPSPSGNSLIHLEFQDPASNPSACATLKVELCWRKVPRKLELRGWRAGDHYRPVGHSRDEKLKEMFQRARVPSWERPVWPILSSGDKILWAKDFGVAAEFAPTAASDRRLRIRETSIATE